MMNRVLIFSVLMAALCALASAGCPEGYTQRDWPNQHGNCYKVWTTPEWWFYAEHFCRVDGGWLATIRNEEDSIWINNFFVDHRGHTCIDWYWVGGDDILREGTWRWQDGSKVIYTNWFAGQPDNGGEEEDGMIVYVGSRKWNDNSTGRAAACFVCETYPTERQCSIVTSN
ncbi:perlucin-like protein [Patiria miniata]|uniref:C-type lectin domain-containing protein n=1 Tax=Patiria miniata TaxID=46514 RepID=A0A913ZV80_PATMI|nr:perlucin-like protein [Patiria miniata]